MNIQQQKCLTAVNEIIDSQENALKSWFMYEFMPENFKTNNIEKNINLLIRFRESGLGEATIVNQLNNIFKAIYFHAAWEIANIINKFPKNCRTAELYLEIFKKNRCILIYTPFKLRKYLDIDSAYDNCEHSPDGSCINCTRSFEMPCSYSYINRNLMSQ